MLCHNSFPPFYGNIYLMMSLEYVSFASHHNYDVWCDIEDKVT